MTDNQVSAICVTIIALAVVALIAFIVHKDW